MKKKRPFEKWGSWKNEYCQQSCLQETAQLLRAFIKKILIKKSDLEARLPISDDKNLWKNIRFSVTVKIWKLWVLKETVFLPVNIFHLILRAIVKNIRTILALISLIIRTSSKRLALTGYQLMLLEKKIQRLALRITIQCNDISVKILKENVETFSDYYSNKMNVWCYIFQFEI